MAGRGGPPKADGRRARRNAQPETTTFESEFSEQPHLPQDFDWPAPTRDWWISWGIHPMAETFTESDWQFLLDTALLHAAVWGKGDLKQLPELRLRVAKYGVTPEDRARLRIQFADANAKDKPKRSDDVTPDDDVKADTENNSARSRYSRKHLSVVEESA